MPVYAADVNEALAAVIYGGVLILFMYVLPTGVVGLARRVGSRPREKEESMRWLSIVALLGPGAAASGCGRSERTGA